MAISTKAIDGRDVTVEVQKSGVWHPYACATSCTFRKLKELVLSTTVGSGKTREWKERRYEWEGSLSGVTYIVPPDTAQITVFKLLSDEYNGLVPIRYTFEDRENNFTTIEGNIILEETTIESGAEDFSSDDISFKGSGPFSINGVTVGGGTNGGGGPVLSGIAALGTPTLNAHNPTQSSIELDGTAVANAVGYKFYQALSNDVNTAVLIATQATTHFVATGLTPGTLYYFFYKAIGNGASFSDSAFASDSETTLPAVVVTPPSTVFDGILDFPSSTQDSDTGVSGVVKVLYVGTPIKFEFHRLSIPLGTPMIMQIYVSGQMQLRVTYQSPYDGKPFRYTAINGTVYTSGVFTNGNVNF